MTKNKEKKKLNCSQLNSTLVA